MGGVEAEAVRQHLVVVNGLDREQCEVKTIGVTKS